MSAFSHLTAQFYTEQFPSCTLALTPFFFLSPLRIFKVHPHTHTHYFVSSPIPPPRPQTIQRYLSKKTPPLPYRHPSHPLFHFRIPPNQPPPIKTQVGGGQDRRKMWRMGSSLFSCKTWVLVFHITVATPPPGIAHSRFHHPGHPSYTTPSLLIRVSLRLKSFWRAGLLVAGGGEEVGGRNWGEIGGRKEGEGGRGGRGVWGGCWGVWGDLEGSRWGEDFCRGLDGVEWMSRVHPDQSSLLQNWCIINIGPFENACFAH